MGREVLKTGIASNLEVCGGPRYSTDLILGTSAGSRDINTNGVRTSVSAFSTAIFFARLFLQSSFLRMQVGSSREIVEDSEERHVKTVSSKIKESRLVCVAGVALLVVDGRREVSMTDLDTFWSPCTARCEHHVRKRL